MTPQQIVLRFEALASQRTTVEMAWDLIERFIGPMRGGKFFQQNSSEHQIDWRRGRDVFDNTAQVAADLLSSSIHTALTSPALQWFEVRFRNDELNKNSEAKVWLESASEEIYQAIADSNFNTEINETYLDLVTYGSSIIVEEEDEAKGELCFSSVPIRECHFEADHQGNLARLFRRYEWSIFQIVEKFGIDKVPEDIKQKYNAPGHIDTKEEVIFCIWRRNGVTSDYGIKTPAGRAYGSCYVLKRTKEKLGEEGGYYEMPAFFIRWKKTSGSMWGHGPGALALSDVMTLNQLVELVLKATGKVVDPASLVTERALLSDLNLDSSGMTVVRDLNGIKAYESAARFDVSALQVEDLRRKINRTFLVDQLQLKESPAMTATEVQVRYEMMQRLLGPTLGRIESDLLDPMIERTFRILMRNGRLPKMPERLALLGRNTDLDIEYTGPLSRAQRIDRVASMERWVSQVGQLSQVMPEILDLPDPDALGRESARLLGVPTRVLRNETAVASLRARRRKEKEKVAALADAGAAATAMEGVAASAKDLALAGGAG